MKIKGKIGRRRKCKLPLRNCSAVLMCRNLCRRHGRLPNSNIKRWDKTSKVLQIAVFSKDFCQIFLVTGGYHLYISNMNLLCLVERHDGWYGWIACEALCSFQNALQAFAYLSFFFPHAVKSFFIQVKLSIIVIIIR